MEIISRRSQQFLNADVVNVVKNYSGNTGIDEKLIERNYTDKRNKIYFSLTIRYGYLLPKTKKYFDDTKKFTIFLN